jgi:hypothetical protein
VRRRRIAYTVELAERILDQLSSGRALMDLCGDEGMPSSNAVQIWVREDREGFAARYRLAREIGRHAHVTGFAGGYPTAYTAEIAARILEELSSGRTLVDVCGDEGLPTSRTVQTWVKEDREGFAARYRLAREIGCHTIADEILAIADDSGHDWVLRPAQAGKPDGPVEIIFDHERIRRDRLRIDARRWLLSHLLPGTYGSRPDLNAGPVVIDTLAELLKTIDGSTRGLPNDQLRPPLDKITTG